MQRRSEFQPDINDVDLEYEILDSIGITCFQGLIANPGTSK